MTFTSASHVPSTTSSSVFGAMSLTLGHLKFVSTTSRLNLDISNSVDFENDRPSHGDGLPQLRPPVEPVHYHFIMISLEGSSCCNLHLHRCKGRRLVIAESRLYRALEV